MLVPGKVKPREMVQRIATKETRVAAWFMRPIGQGIGALDEFAQVFRDALVRVVGARGP